jgi:hypothetical protein
MNCDKRGLAGWARRALRFLHTQITQIFTDYTDFTPHLVPCTLYLVPRTFYPLLSLFIPLYPSLSPFIPLYPPLSLLPHYQIIFFFCEFYLDILKQIHTLQPQKYVNNY